MNFLKKLLTSKTTVVTPLKVTSSNGFHLRPIAKFVNEAKGYDATVTLEFKGTEVSAIQVPKILSLGLEQDDVFNLKCKGKASQKVSEELSAFFRQLMVDDKEVEEIQKKEHSYLSESVQGTIISKGVAIGFLSSYEKEKIVQESSLSLKEALIRTEEELSKLYEKNIETPEAEIFLAHKTLLNSELFQKNFDNIEQEIDALRGGKFESRIADYQDIKSRIESHMGIKYQYKYPNGYETNKFILLADETLLPSDVEELSQHHIAGVILTQGSPTSHVAILLRSFAIPSIICHEKITPTGKHFYSLLDANSGKFIQTPSREELEEADAILHEEKEKRKMDYEKRFEKVLTSSQEKIKILANITDLNSAKEAKELGADGIGLLRTEFLFTEKQPTVEEQTQAYREIFELFNEVTVRTLDIGGDKSLPYINIAKEDNPFLGIRGIRFSLQEQTLFKEQLLAIFKTVGATISHAKIIKIMFPMVNNIEEFKEAKNIAQTVAIENNLDIDYIQFGIMLEVPSVIFALKEFDEIVDFYSIGSNDLTQYLFAIERTHPTLQVDTTSPILMNALQQIINTTTKPLSICGELAGLEEVTKKLVEMGYSTLSVSAKLIPSLKERIRNV